MKKLLPIIFISIFSLFSIDDFAQGNILIRGAVCLPSSDFADDNIFDNNSGLAGFGIGLGFQYFYPLKQNGLNAFVSADFNFNGLKNGAKGDFDKFFGSKADVNYFEYLSIPLLVGLDLSIPITEQVSIFGNLGIGPNFLQRTKMVVEEDNSELNYNWDLSTSIGYKLGGGLLLMEKYRLGVNYLGSGRHTLKGEIEFDNGDTDNLDLQKFGVSIFEISLGVIF